MKFTTIILMSLLLGAMTLTLSAQEKTYQIGEISVINYGDGRALFRENNKEQTPLQGEHRVIDGYNSEYILAKFKDGMYHGDFKHFKHGTLIQQSTYKEGRLDGVSKWYYSDGKTLQREVTFVEGKADGISTTYAQNGKKETEKGFKMGVEHGFDRRYNYDNGELSMDTYYKDGKKDGKWVEHRSGNMGNTISISNYKDGVPVGEFSETFEDGTIRTKGSYKDGKKDGVWVDNRSSMKMETTFKDDEKVEERNFFTDGKISKLTSFANNKRNGVTKEYFPYTGQVKSEFTYKNNLQDGAYKRFYEDGTLREEGRCEKDREIFRKEYHTNGKLKSVAERVNGSWNTTERYDVDGELIK